MTMEQFVAGLVIGASVMWLFDNVVYAQLAHLWARHVRRVRDR